jgi:hypothetical protein
MSSVVRPRRSGVPRRDTTPTVVLVRGGIEIACWPFVGDDGGDLAFVDEVARLQLAARRLGCTLRLRGVAGELWELLDLAGLARVVSRSGGLVVEVGGQPEGGEELGTHEGVEPGDPLA